MKFYRRVLYVAMAAILLVAAVACLPGPTPTSTPLPPRAATSTATDVPAATATPTATATPPPTATSTPPPTASPTATSTPEPPSACGRTGTMTVLLLGESLPEDRPGRGASAIRLLEVDYGAKTVRVLALPPYMQVNTPALSEAGIQATALTLTYWKALELAEGSERAKMAYATDIFLLTLFDNLGLAPDHSISMRQGAFIDMIDALGGLEIELPENVDGSPSGLGAYSAGEQVLDGQAVLDYVTIYPAAADTPPTEWERLDRQEQVLRALRDQLIRPQTLFRFPRLIRRFHQDVVTDLGLGDILTLACMLQESDLTIEHLELPSELFTPGEGKTLFPKTDEIVAYLQETGFIEEAP